MFKISFHGFNLFSTAKNGEFKGLFKSFNSFNLFSTKKEKSF